VATPLQGAGPARWRPARPQHPHPPQPPTPHLAQQLHLGQAVAGVGRAAQEVRQHGRAPRGVALRGAGKVVGERRGKVDPGSGWLEGAGPGPGCQEEPGRACARPFGAATPWRCLRRRLRAPRAASPAQVAGQIVDRVDLGGGGGGGGGGARAGQGQDGGAATDGGASGPSAGNPCGGGKTEGRRGGVGRPEPAAAPAGHAHPVRVGLGVLKARGRQVALARCHERGHLGSGGRWGVGGGGGGGFRQVIRRSGRQGDAQHSAASLARPARRPTPPLLPAPCHPTPTLTCIASAAL
jgi:hypothetical protein